MITCSDCNDPISALTADALGGRCFECNAAARAVPRSARKLFAVADPAPEGSPLYAGQWTHPEGAPIRRPCPVCAAPALEFCRSRSGERADMHAERIGPDPGERGTTRPPPVRYQAPGSGATDDERHPLLLAVACPTCTAQPRVRCRGQERTVRLGHAERRRAAEAELSRRDAVAGMVKRDPKRATP